jgi:dolichol kinase
MSLLGSTYLLLAALLSIELFPQPVAATAIGFTVIGDAFGALVGRAWGKHKVFNKSLEGGLGCLAACLAWAAFVVSVGGVSAPVAIAGAVVATVVEMLPIPLDDNLGITLAAGYTMRLMT